MTNQAILGIEFDAYILKILKKKLILQYMHIGVQSCIQACKCIIWWFVKTAIAHLWGFWGKSSLWGFLPFFFSGENHLNMGWKEHNCGPHCKIMGRPFPLYPCCFFWECRLFNLSLSYTIVLMILLLSFSLCFFIWFWKKKSQIICAYKIFFWKILSRANFLKASCNLIHNRFPYSML